MMLFSEDIPNRVMINGQMIEIEVSVPGDAPIGDYDIVIGNGLGAPCEYRCEGCFRVDPKLGTTPIPMESDMLVYPNPNKGEFIITTANPLYDTCLEIYDTAGKRVIYDNEDSRSASIWIMIPRKANGYIDQKQIDILTEEVICRAFQ